MLIDFVQRDFVARPVTRFERKLFRHGLIETEPWLAYTAFREIDRREPWPTDAVRGRIRIAGVDLLGWRGHRYYFQLNVLYCARLGLLRLRQARHIGKASLALYTEQPYHLRMHADGDDIIFVTNITRPIAAREPYERVQGDWRAFDGRVRLLIRRATSAFADINSLHWQRYLENYPHQHTWAQGWIEWLNGAEDPLDAFEQWRWPYESEPPLPDCIRGGSSQPRLQQPPPYRRGFIR